MGKYFRKPKTAVEVAVMELSQPSLGVRTRAKTLALRRQQNYSASPATVASAPATGDSYLQLRSRRLEKPPIVVHHHHSKRHKLQQQQQGSKKGDPNLDSRVPVGSGSNSEKEKEGENINNDSNDFGGSEASFGENILDIEARERGTRESTPCSLMRDPESIRSPGSTTKPTSSNRRVRNSVQQDIPTSNETDEFFAHAEVDQQRQFIEKYNFDPVKEKPLPGRYQWEKVDHQT